MPDYDIVLIGLGPVGATAAIMLAESGLRVAAVERDEEVYQLPRAVNLDGEIIRALQRFGRGETVAGLMQALRPGDRAGFANARREWMFGSQWSDFGVNGWQPMNMFDQPEFEGYLREQALTQANVTAFIGYEVTDLIDHGDEVLVSAKPLVDENQRDGLRLSGRYAIGCDGASSFVRKTLGAGWQDLGYNHEWLVVDVTVKPGHTLNNDTVQVCDPARITTYVCTKDPYRRWEFKMLPGETSDQMLQTETIHALIDPWTPRDTYEIRRAAVYQFHAATADRWRVGNVFIAGDAAHQTPPFLGQGMNAGMRDVINLSWKFPLVFSGTATDGLLDTYHAEREAHAHDLVDWAVSIGRLMDHLTEVERAKQQGETPPEMPPRLKASGYGQGREQPPLRGGAIRLDQVSDAGSTGYLFSQPIVTNPQSEQLRLDELLGPGFAVVGKAPKDLAVSEDARLVLEKLNARYVCLEGLETVRGHFDRLFREHNAAIIRPDRIVYGHTTGSLTLSELAISLGQQLTLN